MLASLIRVCRMDGQSFVAPTTLAPRAPEQSPDLASTAHWCISPFLYPMLGELVLSNNHPSSPACLPFLQVLADRGEAGSKFGRATFSVLLLQDLAVVVLLMLIPLLAPGPDGASGTAWLVATWVSPLCC